MKLIVAIVEPQQLAPIREALMAHKIYKFTVSNALGQGMDLSKHEVYRGVAYDIRLLKKLRLEIAVNEAFVDTVIEAICGVARQSAEDAGRGKIFVLPIEQCVRIRTGETGQPAIG